jgi:hypothetical protein
MIVPEKRLGLDDLIDSIAPLIIDSPVSGDALLAAMPGTRRVGSKPFAVEGLNDVTQIWEQPRAGERYSALQVGIQLANRSGPLNEIEFSEFVVSCHYSKLKKLLLCSKLIQRTLDLSQGERNCHFF